MLKKFLQLKQFRRYPRKHKFQNQLDVYFCYSLQIHDLSSLLKNLVISDIIVACSCGLIWGIPRGVDHYSRQILPHMAPYLIAISHIAVLNSNLLTSALGFERYVRLKYLCNFRHKNWITKKNLNYYRFSIISFSILFYAPKIFELKPIHVNSPCFQVINRAQSDLTNLYIHIGLYHDTSSSEYEDYDMTYDEHRNISYQSENNTLIG